MPSRPVIRWTPEAAHSLRRIHRRIARDRPTTARWTVDTLLTRIDSIASSPRLGALYPHADPAGPDLDAPRSEDRGQGRVRHLRWGHVRVAYRLVAASPEARGAGPDDEESPTELQVLALFHDSIFLPPR